MGQTGREFEATKRPTHDGALRCVLCADARPGADHGWCVATDCIVCDDCCDALLDGDIQGLVSIAANTGRIVTPETLFHACSQCVRVSRLLGEESFLFDADVDADGSTLC